MRSFYKSSVLLTAAVAALGMVACAQPDQSEAPEIGRPDGIDIRALIEALRPDQAELQQILQKASSNSQAATPVALAGGLQPENSEPTVSAIELTPILIDSTGTRWLDDSSLTITDIEQGTIALLPYEVQYADASTAFSGYLRLYFTWEESLNYFVQANPAYTLSELIAGESAYIEGTMYNWMVDQLDGVSHDNGQIVDGIVQAINDSTNEVYTAHSDTQGNYRLGPLPIGVTYTIIATVPGFAKQRLPFPIDEATLTSGFDFDMIAEFDQITQTTHIYGKVVDLAGSPVFAAAVVLVDAATNQPIPGVIGRQTNQNGEYMLNHVKASPGNSYRIEVISLMTVVHSSTFSIAESNTPYMTEKNVTIDGYVPEITCSAGGQDGDSVTVEVEVGGTLNVAATGTDVDEDLLQLVWHEVTGGQLNTLPFAFGDSQMTAVFQAPSQPMNVQLLARVNDDSGFDFCRINIEVVWPSN